MSNSERTHGLLARWIFPNNASPIENGIIEIENGRIGGLHSGRHAAAENLGDVAVIPGLVNAHTHLEFSALRRPIGPAEPFPAWIRAVIDNRRMRRGETRPAIAMGLQESSRSGTTLVGEIATDDVSAACFDDSTPAGVVFRELLGISDETAEAQLAVARRHLAAWPHAQAGDVIGGLSPHAPYSVSERLFRESVQLAADAQATVAMHLAETPAELELLQRGTGPLAELLKGMGIWRDRFWLQDDAVLGYLKGLAQAPRALIIHGNYLTPPEIDFLAEHPQMTVVYCPRTHRYFGHAEHPWRTLLERGASVALGTDGRASNPDLNVWNEIQFLRQTCDGPARTLFELATIRGATALGREAETGTLDPGKSADLAVVTLSDEARTTAARRPFDALLHPGNRVTATMRNGRWICR